MSLKILKIFILFCFIANLNCLGYKKYVKSGFAMGADLTIIIFSDNKKRATVILEKCFEIADKLEELVSSKKKTSIISDLNFKREVFINDKFTLELIKDAKRFAEITGGSFDPTLFELINLWGIENGENIIPSAIEIKKAISDTGYQNIFIDGNFVRLDNKALLDLGGIAAGKIIGEISCFLKNEGVKDFLINSSGDLTISGKFQGTRDWVIGIANPFDSSKLIGEIKLTDCSIVTSGDYEKYFMGEDGKRYHHIFDPKTGYPSKNSLRSVTLISDSPVKCDALSTALFVMGREEGLNFLEENDKMEGIFIENDENNYKVIYSSGIKADKNETGTWDFVLKKRF